MPNIWHKINLSLPITSNRISIEDVTQVFKQECLNPFPLSEPWQWTEVRPLFYFSLGKIRSHSAPKVLRWLHFLYWRVLDMRGRDPYYLYTSIPANSVSPFPDSFPPLQLARLPSFALPPLLVPRDSMFCALLWNAEQSPGFLTCTSLKSFWVFMKFLGFGYYSRRLSVKRRLQSSLNYHFCP